MLVRKEGEEEAEERERTEREKETPRKGGNEGERRRDQVQVYKGSWKASDLPWASFIWTASLLSFSLSSRPFSSSSVPVSFSTFFLLSLSPPSFFPPARRARARSSASASRVFGPFSFLLLLRLRLLLRRKTFRGHLRAGDAGDDVTSALIGSGRVREKPLPGFPGVKERSPPPVAANFRACVIHESEVQIYLNGFLYQTQWRSLMLCCLLAYIQIILLIIVIMYCVMYGVAL